MLIFILGVLFGMGFSAIAVVLVGFYGLLKLAEWVEMPW